jgi:hypothetical protein
MQKIELVGGEHRALVDDADYEWLMNSRWWVHRPKRSKTLYARTKSDGAWLLMHRTIMAPIMPGMVIDHIDRNGLNNTRANLRVVTQSENATFLARALNHQNVHAVTSRGRTYYYWQAKRSTEASGHRVRLPDDTNSAEFQERVANLNNSIL